MNGFFPTTGISVVKIDSEYPRNAPKGRVNVNPTCSALARVD